MARVEDDLKSNRKDVYNQVKLISVFYRYVQWGLAVGNDVKSKLKNFVIQYLNDTRIATSDKEYLKKIIKNEKVKFDSKNWGMEKNPMETLFGDETELVNLIE